MKVFQIAQLNKKLEKLKDANLAFWDAVVVMLKWYTIVNSNLAFCDAVVIMLKWYTVVLHNDYDYIQYLFNNSFEMIYLRVPPTVADTFKGVWKTHSIVFYFKYFILR